MVRPNGNSTVKVTDVNLLTHSTDRFTHCYFNKEVEMFLTSRFISVAYVQFVDCDQNID